MNETLFDLETVRQDSPRLISIRRHDIQTAHSPHCEDGPWLAIPMQKARAVAEKYREPDGKTESIGGMVQHMGIRIQHLMFFGDSERDAQDRALEYCLANK